MSLRERYRTVAHGGGAVLTEKKSKFIASVRPVESEEEAAAFINEIRSRYSDARHNVYAYVIDENNIFRYSDDGEPQGTAGMPVLDTVRGEGLVDTAVVITRYFGGTLLGTGGLVRAYSSCARLGIENAGIVTRTLCDIVSVKADYPLVGKIQHFIASGGYILSDTVYENDVTFTVCSPTGETEKLVESLTDITSAGAVCEINGQEFIDLS